MTGPGFLELIASLAVQVCVVIGICAWLVRHTGGGDAGHRLWSVCHVLILAQTAAALLLPHLRLLPHAIVTEHLPLPLVATSEVWLGRAAMGVWGVGALLYAVGMFLGALNVHRLIAAAQPLPRPLDPEIPHVTCLVSPHISVPFCWQIQRPIIVLPENLRTHPAEELQAIIRHELAHLRSAHPVCLFLQRLVEMLFWLHPLVWWASRQADLHREFHCDREASRAGQETANYLRGLLRLAETSPAGACRFPVGLGFEGSRNNIRVRVARLIHESREQPPARSAAPLPLALMAAAAVASTVLWLPIDAYASSRSVWSPWPRWSARRSTNSGLPHATTRLMGIGSSFTSGTRIELSPVPAGPVPTRTNNDRS